MAGTDRMKIRNLLNPTSPCTEALGGITLPPCPSVDGSHRQTTSVVKRRAGKYCLHEVDFQRNNPYCRAWVNQDAVNPLDAQRSPPGRPILPSSNPSPSVKPSLNNARALRVVELINDYRTLLIHIMELTESALLRDTGEGGYVVLDQSRLAVQRLLTSSHEPEVSNYGEEENIRVNQLREAILDASARRHQAHKLYLRVSAARRWVINRASLIHDYTENHGRLGKVDTMLREELDDVSDGYIFSHLREADLRAGYWVDEDPRLIPIVDRAKSLL